MENIAVKKTDGICLITINRPNVLNALNTSTLLELQLAVRDAADDKQVRVLIITGAGEKSFVAGADIFQMSQLSSLEGRKMTMIGQHVFDLIETLEKPVIAAINGYALGGGCELAMACDIRVASENAKFGQPEVNLGIIPGFAGTQRLSRLIGRGKAKYYIFTTDMIMADEALSLGLVEKVVPFDKLMITCRNIAKKIMDKGPIAIQMAKKAINTGLDIDMRSGMAYEAEAYTTCFATHDRIEGMTAFLEKRKAKFEGK
ncbi:enoyl-CoA hydratase-related protein [Megasphaera paucivorans]|uniref:Enoyl-CoA hydratase n=1 Tax=Megasphaera paucivorans TaxID=349095 RepID=A0A1G9WVQ7_9FIRM|nr:enoyl-CoA hydratase-related protein [Megasphaera paucivorans]SDM88577.1 enoyl-CoA hydratase [Megasphaera paucivorans]